MPERIFWVGGMRVSVSGFINKLNDAARRQWVQRPRAKGPRAPSAPLMEPWGRRARGPRAPSAPFGQGTKGPMGPLGVIPRSFRVDGNYEWVVIERNNGAFPNWEPTLNQFALTTRREILLKRDIILPRVGPFSSPFGAIPTWKLSRIQVTTSRCNF